MKPRNSTAERILDAAEKKAREGGFGGFSFRELASELGIKSASVHYHFPTKEALGADLVRRYTERIAEILAGSDPSEGVAPLIGIFRKALYEEDRMCLCGIMGAEGDSLPPLVHAEVARFFSRILEWLQPIVGSNASAVLALLEGGLIVAKTTGDRSHFDRASKAALQYS